MNNILKKGISGLLLLGALFMLPQGADARAAAGHYVRTNAAGQVNGTLDVFEIKGQQYFDVHAYNHEGSDPRPVKTGMADNMITAGPVTDDTFKITNSCYQGKIDPNSDVIRRYEYRNMDVAYKITEKENAVVLASDKDTVKVDIAGEYRLADPAPKASYIMAEALIDSIDTSITGIPQDQELRYVYDKENLYDGVKYPGAGAIGPCYKVKIYTEKTLQLQESFLVPMAMQDVYRVAYDNSVTKIF